MLDELKYYDFLVGRNEDVDQSVSSVGHQTKRVYQDDNSSRSRIFFVSLLQEVCITSAMD